MTTPDPRSGESPGANHDVRPDAPGTPAAGAGPATPPRSSPASTDRTGQPRSSRRGAGRSIGLGLAAALLVFVTVVLVLFIMFNTQTVQISLVFGEVQAPLVLALLIAAALGGLLVLLLGAVLKARRPRS